MKKVICYERRTANSARIHYNREGDWRPRLIVWPEYDGKSKEEFEEYNSDAVDDETDTEWGQIVAKTLAEFQRRHSLVTFAFELVWPSLWERITSQYALPRCKMNGTISPNQVRIVQVAREPFFANVDGLGFDVGYWGGDHYSMICDSAVCPLWHPPPPECFDELAWELKMVNESFLFSTAEGATWFRFWYRT